MAELAAPKLLAAFPGALLRLRTAALLALSRGLSMVAQLGAQVAVGAVAGGSGIGLLQLHTAWTTVLGELVALGEPTQALRRSAVETRAGAQRRALRDASRRIGRAWAGLCIAAGGIALLYGLAVSRDHSASPPRDLLVLAVLASAPLFALSRLAAETLKGNGHALGAVTLENGVAPLLTLLFCAAIACGVMPFSTPGLMVVAVGGNLACLCGLLWLNARHTPSAEDAQPAPVTTSSTAADAAERRHFWASSLLNIAFLQCPFLLLPLFATADDIGHYAVAHKLLNVITTLLILLAATYAPRFARASAAGDAAGLRSLLVETQRLSLLVYVPGALLVLALCDPLSALFNLHSASLLPLLVILAGSQLLNAATGLSGVLLNMSGGAGLEMRILIIACGLLLACALIFAPTRGAEGVAIAAGVAIAFRNVASYLGARRRLLTRP